MITLLWSQKIRFYRPFISKLCIYGLFLFFSARDCWAVAFGHSHNETDRVVAAGYDNGDLKMFDLRAMSVRWETQLDNGICGLAFDRKDIEMNKLLATCLEGRIHMWDLRTFHEKKGFTGVSQKVEKGHTIWVS